MYIFPTRGSTSSHFVWAAPLSALWAKCVPLNLWQKVNTCRIQPFTAKDWNAKIMMQKSWIYFGPKKSKGSCVFSTFFFGLEKSAKGKGWGRGRSKNEILSITSYYIFAVKAWKARKPWNIEQDKKTVFVASVLSSLIFFLAQQTSNIQEKGFAPRSPVSNYTISVKKSPPQIVALVKNSEGGAWWNTWWRGKYASINIIIPFWKWHAHHWNF